MPGSKAAHALLQTAKTDLKALEHMLDSDAFEDSIFGFHAQQAVEKSLKAWLVLLRNTHPFTHDLGLLLHSLEELGTNVDSYWSFLDLGGYAVRFRYESLSEGEDPLDRDELLRDVRALVVKVEELFH